MIINQLSNEMEGLDYLKNNIFVDCYLVPDLKTVCLGHDFLLNGSGEGTTLKQDTQRELRISLE